jgi:hypothetical protein
MTPEMNLLGNKNALSNIFIRIKDERTPCGNFLFRLDQMTLVSVIDNKGLTPLLEVSGGHVEPSVTYEQFIDFITFVIRDASVSDNEIKIYELVINEETVRELAPRTEKIFTR